MVLCLLVLLCVFTDGAGTLQWPEHVLCDTSQTQLTYTSCDPFQDVGFTINNCPVRQSGKTNIKLKVSLLLRHSIEELFLSVDVSAVDHGVEHHLFMYPETLCLRSLQRFTFCGRRRGELMNQDWPVDLKVELKGHYKAQLRLVNQDADLIACANITLNLK
ncbi:lymphocyte antigen 86 [Engraulis encrasicolus]|uniref:lymphocyte antigen 86 n=1 Tax=Engraulis encrasicolus TaxID=184585 RepID=UPI002FD4307C